MSKPETFNKLSEEKKTKKNIRIQKKIEEAFEKLEKIKEDENIPGYIKYNIIKIKKRIRRGK